MAGFRELFELPPRLYAIGDLHGCSQELSKLLTHLREIEQLNSKDLVVFIGDYIDRGPDSKGVVDQLLEFKKQFPTTVFLKGNHEDMLLDYLELGGRQGVVFLDNGGGDTFSSYGIPIETLPIVASQKFPPAHLDFFQSLDRYLIVGNFAFVHAGFNPLRDLQTQIDEDLFWIRDPFINNIHHFGKTVVFGHTPYEDLLVHLPYKIGIDTGVVYGNKLTCIELIGQRMLQIEAGEEVVQIRKIRA